jgi:hypothetical protein
MANEQLIELLCTTLPHFKQLWLSAEASSIDARRRLLQEIDQLTFETVLTLMAESSRFRLIALECSDRHQLNVEIEKGLWERIKQLVNYLLGKPDAKSAAAATLQIKVWIAIFLGGSAAVGAGIHHHIVVKSHSPALVVPVISPSPAITVPAAAPSPAISPTVAPLGPAKVSPADAHKPAGSEKATDAPKHHTPAHVAKKDNPVTAKDGQKTAETPKTEVAQKKGIFGFLKKAAVGDTTETNKQSASPSTNTDKQSASPSKSTDTQTSANTQKKGGLFGFLKKNKHKNDQTNTNNDKTTNGASN